MSILATILVISLITAGLIVYDVFMYLNGTPNSLDTISGRMRIWGMTTPFIPFVWAVLAGHFFGPVQFNHLMPQRVALGLLIFLGWAVIATGIYARHSGFAIPPWAPLLPGFIAGAILWHQ